jgi:hypothetical protein
MKRLLPAATIALLFAAFTGVAGATHSEGSGPTDQDFAVGTVKLSEVFGGGTFHFDAHSGPNGEDPRGHYFARHALGLLDVSFRSRVECMRTFPEGDATVSIIGTRVTRPESPTAPPEGSAVLFRVVDRGEPGAGRDEFNGRPTADPQDCKTQDVQPAFPIESGNWVVHDAP